MSDEKGDCMKSGIEHDDFSIGVIADIIGHCEASASTDCSATIHEHTRS